MTTFDWTTAIAECCTHLASLGNLPPPAVEDSALQAIAVLSLIADTPIRHALTSDSTAPVLTIPRYSGRHDLVDNLRAELTVDVAAPARGNFIKHFLPKTGLTSTVSTNWGHYKKVTAVYARPEQMRTRLRPRAETVLP